MAGRSSQWRSTIVGNRLSGSALGHGVQHCLVQEGLVGGGGCSHRWPDPASSCGRFRRSVICSLCSFSTMVAFPIQGSSRTATASTDPSPSRAVYSRSDRISTGSIAGRRDSWARAFVGCDPETFLSNSQSRQRQECVTRSADRILTTHVGSLARADGPIPLLRCASGSWAPRWLSGSRISTPPLCVGLSHARDRRPAHP